MYREIHKEGIILRRYLGNIEVGIEVSIRFGEDSFMWNILCMCGKMVFGRGV
jgi:hypothetical protein